MAITIIEKLNHEQRIASTHIEGPLLVLAGAGSGKTRVVTCRIAYLLDLGVPADEILALTFTNKAAEEMRRRVQELSHQKILACTFHSLAARILRESIHHLDYPNNFTIFDEEDSEKVFKEVLVALQSKEGKSETRSLRAEVSRYKNELLLPEDIDSNEGFIKDVYRLYQEKLKLYGALDFDDLILLTVHLFKKHAEILAKYQARYRFILIDEYQDTNQAQSVLVKLLSAKTHNVFAVGDPDQSIYSWRGADITNILHFQDDFPSAKKIALEQNYRSTQTILLASNALISHNAQRFPKNLWSSLGEGELIQVLPAASDRMEAEEVVALVNKRQREQGIALSDQVIFYRTNAQSRVFEDVLLRNNIPYKIIGGISFYQRREIKDILSLLRLALGGNDFVAFFRTLNQPKRGFGDTTLRKMEEGAHMANLSVVPFCEQILSGYIPFKLSQKQHDGLKEYIQGIKKLQAMIIAKETLDDLLREALHVTNYLAFLKEDQQSFEDRFENIQQLIGKALEWQEENSTADLVSFLEEISLKSSADVPNAASDTLNLMTLHNSKGLEFRAVYLTGMEEDLFPHFNTYQSSSLLEEERRLCYVGMTRAKELLCLSSAKNRLLWGTPRMMTPSRFLSEIPEEYITLQKARSGYFQPLETNFLTPADAEFSVGHAVIHRDFGKGIIEKKYQTSLGLTYDVYFPHTDCHRSLVAKFAKLSSA